jgi:olfactory receptor
MHFELLQKEPYEQAKPRPDKTCSRLRQMTDQATGPRWHLDTEPTLRELEIFIVGGKGMIVLCLTIFISYGFMLSGIFHTSSTEDRSKAFSTCSSHITALSPSSAGSTDEGKNSCLLYQCGSDDNPLIYNLRNKDIKVAVRKTLN